MIFPGLGWRDWWIAAKAIFNGMNDQNLALISAGVAFYGMLAMFPAVAAMIAVWGVFADPLTVSQEIEVIRAFVPPDAYEIMDGQITQLARTSSSTLGWATILSLLVALWSSRLGVEAMIRGLNTIYGERNRTGLRQFAAAFGITFLLMAVTLVALGSVVVLPILLALFPLGGAAELTLAGIRWIVAITVVVLAISAVYRFGPNRRRARVPWLTPGALVAVVFWGVASYGFSYYLSNFGSYNEIYGTLGAVIALLMWLYISAFVVLIGAALNAELEKRTYRDSTIGPSRPPGERGAHAADVTPADGAPDPDAQASATPN